MYNILLVLFTITMYIYNIQFIYDGHSSYFMSFDLFYGTYC